MIKSRKAKNSKRGLYLQDSELKQTAFQPGTPIKYVIDNKNKQMVILPSDTNSLNTVSKRKTKTGMKPVIDIRNHEALKVFKDADYLQVEILENQILVSGYEESSVLQKASKKWTSLFSKKSNLVDISSILDVRKKCEVRMSIEDLAQAVGSSPILEQLSIFDVIGEDNSFTSSTVKTIERALQHIKIPLQVISVFSGAGIMDMGFVEEGFDVAFALEKDKDAVETYKENHSNHIELADITTFDKSKFGQVGSPVMISGSPCQGFSESNRHNKYLDNPNNLLVKQYIESVKANPNCAIFVLENVPQILSCGNGRFKEEVYEALNDFEITSGTLSAADFGEAQDRERAFFIGSKIGKIELPKPTHKKSEYTTVRSAFQGLHNGIPNQMDFSKPKSSTVERMKFVPEGGNWKSIPTHLQTKSMLKGDTHSSVYKRLAWDKPSITVVNPRKILLTHPSENRILSIRECARLFGLKDDFVFKSNLASMQQQWPI
ncbi:DNA cytosine methyltransferase [Psychrobacillus sp. FSL H8-0484]|uniref:DNA cytosine methyltransferase n=1 Tax=Psychrobacillus sp. FSL H8-0484 TaxID=2921390 RepID=UPI0030F91FB1